MSLDYTITELKVDVWHVNVNIVPDDVGLFYTHFLRGFVNHDLLMLRKWFFMSKMQVNVS